MGGLPSTASIAAVATARVVGVVALAPAGIPFTICMLSWPYANSDTLKGDRSVICGGAVQAVGAEVGGTVVISVAVEGTSETVTVTGGGITVAVIVTKSVVVVSGAGDDVAAGTVIGGDGKGVLDGWGFDVSLVAPTSTVEVSSTSTAEVTTWVTRTT